jgi:short-subunit dehydrogenase
MTQLCTIVGAGPGLGAALGRRFEKAGYRIALIGRQLRQLEYVANEISVQEGQVGVFIADAGDEDELATALGRARTWGGDTDILIYNAAAMSEGLASTVSTAGLIADMAVNIGGAITAVRTVLPAMRARRRGTILFTGGGLALEPYPEWTSLAAGKAALRAYAIALHKEVALDNVHVAVVAICGLIEPGGLFDPDLLAEHYWRLHAAPATSRPRELVYLPTGADPFYSDQQAKYRATSRPIRATDIYEVAP